MEHDRVESKSRRVRVDFPFRKQIIYDADHIVVNPGDVIEWTPEKDFPICVVVKAECSPLDAPYYTSEGGRPIRAAVRRDAKYGYYPYALISFNGERIVVEDPDIIVVPPGQRGG
jgi:plastocyanin